MKERTIPVLLACIVLLGGFIALQEYWRSEQQSRSVDRLKTFEIDQVSLTAMQFKGTNFVVECTKENGIWMVGEPGKGKGLADVALFYQLVAAFNRTTNTTTITAKELRLRGLNVEEYGFDPPYVVITAVDNQGRHSWEIGRTTPLGNEVYIRESDGDEIYTIASELVTIIPGDPDLLRNRVLFTSDIAALKRVEIRGPGGFVRIAKEPSTGWRLQQPIVAQADPREVTAYLEGLYKTRVEDFLGDNVSDFSAYGLQNDTRQIALGSSDGTSRTIVFGDAIPGRPGLIYARRADDTSVFALNESVLQLLNVSANRFRDARVVTLSKPQISEVAIRHGGQQLEITRDDAGAWKIESPVVWNADADSVGQLIDLWNHAVIIEFDVATNALSGDWAIDFIARESGFTNRIDVLPAGDSREGLLVRLNGGASVFRINLPMIPGSLIDPLIYKDKRIWNLSREEISKLILQRPGQPRQVVERSAEGAFVATEANGNAPVNTAAIERLITLLCNLNTSGYIAYNPKSLEIYGLASPAVELYVGLSDANELGRVLLIGRESTEGFYSMIKGRDVVFYLDRASVESLSADLVMKPDGAVQAAE